MGSKSSSSSSASTNTNTNTKNVNVQGVQGTSVFTDGNVTVTDSGATARALNANLSATKKAIDTNRLTVTQALKFGGDAVAGVVGISQNFLDSQQKVNDAALGAVTDAIQYAETAATDDTAETIQTMIKWSAGAAIVIGGVWAMKKG